jgi:membrane-bound lytic murein transglycosylase A
MSRTSASSASSNKISMAHSRSRTALAGAAAGVALALLGSCASVPLPEPSETPSASPLPGSVSSPSGGPPVIPGFNVPLDSSTPIVTRARSRWVSVGWSELPGWDADRQAELWTPLLRSCERPLPGWDSVCAQARSMGAPTDVAARAWLQQRLQPYRVENADGAREGLITGYFEPLVEASRIATGAFQIPLYLAPTDLATRKPYWTRQQLDTMPAAQTSLRGREIAYVADPLDALVLQIQGSGRLHLTEADGSVKLVRIAFAAHNDQPYKSVGRWLIDQGEMRLDQTSWPAIKAWAQRNPKRLNEMLWSNPRVVFFKEEPLPNPDLGPRGAQGVPLTPGRSVAVDRESIPYGTLLWLDTTEPLSRMPLRRAVVAQDTGTAITGAVRADFFWGWGAQAEQQAGRMKQPLRMWVLWPRG